MSLLIGTGKKKIGSRCRIECLGNVNTLGTSYGSGCIRSKIKKRETRGRRSSERTKNIETRTNEVSEFSNGAQVNRIVEFSNISQLFFNCSSISRTKRLIKFSKKNYSGNENLQLNISKTVFSTGKNCSSFSKYLDDRV